MTPDAARKDPPVDVWLFELPDSANASVLFWEGLTPDAARKYPPVDDWLFEPVADSPNASVPFREPEAATRLRLGR